MELSGTAIILCLLVVVSLCVVGIMCVNCFMGACAGQCCTRNNQSTHYFSGSHYYYPLKQSCRFPRKTGVHYSVRNTNASTVSSSGSGMGNGGPGGDPAGPVSMSKRASFMGML